MSNNQKNQKKTTKDRLNSYAKISGAGFQMLATIGVGAYIGYKLDEKFPNKHNLYTVIFTLLFIAIALYMVIRQVSKFTKQQDSND